LDIHSFHFQFVYLVQYTTRRPSARSTKGLRPHLKEHPKAASFEGHPKAVIVKWPRRHRRPPPPLLQPSNSPILLRHQQKLNPKIHRYLKHHRPSPRPDILYKRLVDQFPPIARLWLARAEHCSRFKPEETVTIFEQGVKNASTSIELWRAYLNHLITSVSQAEAQGQPANINGIVPVFERAVEAAGLDLQATPLWNDYVDFLRSRAVLSDPQRRDALRLVFQRAVMIFTSFTANTRNRRRKAPLYAPSPPREYSYINLLVFSMRLIYFYLALLLSGALSSSFMSYSIHFQTFSITNPFFLYVRLVGSNSHAAT